MSEIIRNRATPVLESSTIRSEDAGVSKLGPVSRTIRWPRPRIRTIHSPVAPMHT